VTPTEINAIIAERMGFICAHQGADSHEYADCPDMKNYYDNYPALSAAEREVYPYLTKSSHGEPYTVQVTDGGCDECSYDDLNGWCAMVFDSDFELGVHGRPSELHARAECLARVIEAQR